MFLGELDVIFLPMTSNLFALFRKHVSLSPPTHTVTVPHTRTFIHTHTYTHTHTNTLTHTNTHAKDKETDTKTVRKTYTEIE